MNTHTLRLLTSLLLAPLVALHATEPVTPPGDRNLPINPNPAIELKLLP